MDEILKTTLLYDFYSGLLTDKQRRFFELYYFDNLSTLEIGEAHAVTPQAVWDLVKRTLQLLNKYESKLGLVEKHLSRKKDVEKICRTVNEILENDDLRPEARGSLENIKALAAKLAD